MERDDEVLALIRAVQLAENTFARYAGPAGMNLLAIDADDREIASILARVQAIEEETSTDLADLVLERGGDPTPAPFSPAYTQYNYIRATHALHLWLPELDDQQRQVRELAEHFAPDHPGRAVLERLAATREPHLARLREIAKGIAAREAEARAKKPAAPKAPPKPAHH